MVRCFEDGDVVHVAGKVDPVEDAGKCARLSSFLAAAPSCPWLPTAALPARQRG